MIPELLLFLALAAVVFLFAGVLSPFEALGWWAGWYGREADETEVGLNVSDAAAHAPDLPPTPDGAPRSHYVVFLSGINSVSGEAFAEREIAFLARLKRALPEVALVDDLFPYSVTAQPLTGSRVFARFWRWALRRKLSGPGLAGFLINLRNLWQVAVSADSRYGPMYNQGSAQMILGGLRRHGYRAGAHGTDTPVILIGYSGGGQIAVGAAPHLKKITGAPVSVISLGGVMSADPGLLSLERLYHLYGTRDNVQRLGNIFFPGRWPFIPSPWNSAKARGIIELIPMGPMDHTGPGGYLDLQSYLPDGRSYLEATTETIVKLVRASERRPVRVYPAPQVPEPSANA
ncbi:hypothetical protein [Truepera radiovictrix]|uniref:Uncharacterized protein n=1 Tax=Truepera radiovictrix (strain DSM 17093 / CIP 108686 / LMG 22925 / RQ-24) TaxID=649638 RepID=D7CSB9_TRURR|nr:hypothetical protein [Truepera radiovictrix]ADI13651.1 conserved hypothetical protein [Truepera radiovictrix DSM 17093]WMT57787.1 hypothetical protein RCV51_02285 [Truepera radiovictrix]